jgi:hypothetical protein
MAVQTHISVFSELVDFLIAYPPLEAIVDFHPSEGVSERVAYLLERNQHAALTPDEREELSYTSNVK